MPGGTEVRGRFMPYGRPGPESPTPQYVRWKGIPVHLFHRKDYHLGHARNGDDVTFGSFWIKPVTKEKSSLAHHVWLSSEQVPGFIMIANGMPGDSISMQEPTGQEKRYSFDSLWRDCALIVPQAIDHIVLKMNWREEEISRRDQRAPLHLDVTVLLHAGFDPRQELVQFPQNDYHLISMFKSYYSVAYPPEADRLALAIDKPSWDIEM